MYARTPAQPRRARASELKSFPAPVGGWVSNRALANPLELGVKQGAAVLDNFFPRSGSVKLRRGKQLYATLENTAIDVTAIFSYRNGNNERLFAANEERIYDLTTVLSPFAAEVVTEEEALIVTEDGDWFGFGSTQGLDQIGGFSGGDWVTVQFATTGNVYLLGVNGEDDGFVFDGTYFWPNLPGGVFRLNYDAETVAFTDGETVTGGTSGATGTIYRVINLGAGAGILMLRDVTGTFADNEALTDGGGGAATADQTQTNLSPGVTFGTSGLTVADMDYIWIYKKRVWFAQKNSLNAWYLDDPDAIGGDATIFPLAGEMGLGGSLMFGQAWSLEGGAAGGLSEQNAFVSTQGEVVIYQGVWPGVADTWSKVGTYRIGTPLGKRAFLRGGGDLAIATAVGLVPLSKAISLDVTSLNIATVSYNIADAWSDAVTLRGLSDWQCQLWPEQKMAIVSPPNLIGANQPVLFVSNTETGAWARFTNWYALCMDVFQGKLFFGTTEGRVYIANVSGLDDNETYTGTALPLFEDLGSPGSVKIGKMVRAVSRANANVNAQATINYDFRESVPAPPDASASIGGNFWGAGIWGQAQWGQTTPSVINQGWQSGAGIGYTMAPVYQVTSGAIVPLDDEVIRFDLTYTAGEIVT